MALFFFVGGEDVLANAVDGISTRNADQGTYTDITTRLNASWHFYFQNITSVTPPDDNNWRTEVLGFFRDMLELLECRVVYDYFIIVRHCLGGFYVI